MICKRHIILSAALIGLSHGSVCDETQYTAWSTIVDIKALFVSCSADVNITGARDCIQGTELSDSSQGSVGDCDRCLEGVLETCWTSPNACEPDISVCKPSGYSPPQYEQVTAGEKFCNNYQVGLWGTNYASQLPPYIMEYFYKVDTKIAFSLLGDADFEGGCGVCLSEASVAMCSASCDYSSADATAATCSACLEFLTYQCEPRCKATDFTTLESKSVNSLIANDCLASGTQDTIVKCLADTSVISMDKSCQTCLSDIFLDPSGSCGSSCTAGSSYDSDACSACLSGKYALWHSQCKPSPAPGPSTKTCLASEYIDANVWVRDLAFQVSDGIDMFPYDTMSTRVIESNMFNSGKSSDCMTCITDVLKPCETRCTKGDPSNSGSSSVYSMIECRPCLDALVDDAYIQCSPQPEKKCTSSSFAMWSRIHLDGWFRTCSTEATVTNSLECIKFHIFSAELSEPDCDTCLGTALASCHGNPLCDFDITSCAPDGYVPSEDPPVTPSYCSEAQRNEWAVETFADYFAGKVMFSAIKLDSMQHFIDIDYPSQFVPGCLACTLDSIKELCANECSSPKGLFSKDDCSACVALIGPSMCNPTCSSTDVTNISALEPKDLAGILADECIVNDKSIPTCLSSAEYITLAPACQTCITDVYSTPGSSCDSECAPGLSYVAGDCKACLRDKNESVQSECYSAKCKWSDITSADWDTNYLRDSVLTCLNDWTGPSTGSIRTCVPQDLSNGCSDCVVSAYRVSCGDLCIKTAEFKSSTCSSCLSAVDVKSLCYPEETYCPDADLIRFASLYSGIQVLAGCVETDGSESGIINCVENLETYGISTDCQACFLRNLVSSCASSCPSSGNSEDCLNCIISSEADKKCIEPPKCSIDDISGTLFASTASLSAQVISGIFGNNFSVAKSLDINPPLSGDCLDCLTNAIQSKCLDNGGPCFTRLDMKSCEDCILEESEYQSSCLMKPGTPTTHCKISDFTGTPNWISLVPQYVSDTIDRAPVSSSTNGVIDVYLNDKTSGCLTCVKDVFSPCSDVCKKDMNTIYDMNKCKACLTQLSDDADTLCQPVKCNAASYEAWKSVKIDSLLRICTVDMTPAQSLDQCFGGPTDCDECVSSLFADCYSTGSCPNVDISVCAPDDYVPPKPSTFVPNGSETCSVSDLAVFSSNELAGCLVSLTRPREYAYCMSVLQPSVSEECASCIKAELINGVNYSSMPAVCDITLGLANYPNCSSFLSGNVVGACGVTKCPKKEFDAEWSTTLSDSIISSLLEDQNVPVSMAKAIDSFLSDDCSKCVRRLLSTCSTTCTRNGSFDSNACRTCINNKTKDGGIDVCKTFSLPDPTPGTPTTQCSIPDYSSGTEWITQLPASVSSVLSSAMSSTTSAILISALLSEANKSDNCITCVTEVMAPCVDRCTKSGVSVPDAADCETCLTSIADDAESLCTPVKCNSEDYYAWSNVKFDALYSICTDPSSSKKSIDECFGGSTDCDKCITGLFRECYESGTCQQFDTSACAPADYVPPDSGYQPDGSEICSETELSAFDAAALSDCMLSATKPHEFGYCMKEFLPDISAECSSCIDTQVIMNSDYTTNMEFCDIGSGSSDSVKCQEFLASYVPQHCEVTICSIDEFEDSWTTRLSDVVISNLLSAENLPASLTDIMDSFLEFDCAKCLSRLLATCSSVCTRSVDASFDDTACKTCIDDKTKNGGIDVCAPTDDGNSTPEEDWLGTASSISTMIVGIVSILFAVIL